MNDKQMKIKQKEEAFKDYKKLPMEYRLAAFALLKSYDNPPSSDFLCIDLFVEGMGLQRREAILMPLIRMSHGNKNSGSGNNYFDELCLTFAMNAHKEENIDVPKAMDITEELAAKFRDTSNPETIETAKAYNVALETFEQLVDEHGMWNIPNPDEKEDTSEDKPIE